jgi:superfamily II DNA or RNA helicase
VTTFAPGSLVSARGREWVVLPDSDEELLVLRPLGGGEDETAAVLPALEQVISARFPPPGPGDLGDASGGHLLRTALQIGFRSSAGPFRSLANLAVEPRAYQYVPLLLALRQSPVRILIADDVGIGKTVEAGLIATELIAQGDAQRLAVLCSPALAEQWQRELREKFSIDAEVVLPSTVGRLSRGLMLDESLFDRHSFTIISTDFIKSPQRSQEFVNHCPDLVIVDEAHTCIADGAGGGGTSGRTQRFDLMRRIAAKADRHLVLITATPHSGKAQGFQNLVGLLDPELATLDLDAVEGRSRLARHFVQRRRGDVRKYLTEDTDFPSDRLSREAPYRLSPEYTALFERVLAYARGQVGNEEVAAGEQLVHRRVRWWSVLALLRALASSPVAAAATLRTRASAASAATVQEADALGRAAVLDTADTDVLEGIDALPGADPDPVEGDGGSDQDRDQNKQTARVEDGVASPSNRAATRERRFLLDLARAADGLVGPTLDRKLAVLTTEVKALLADGYDPIVFCRFIPTAGYVATYLQSALRSTATVTAVTGELPPALREERIAELSATPGRHVLVATDCLSEGVNLQSAFQAVVHYDLAWNPTRHEQREGRVDRFGQERDIVRAVTIYGQDNGIDQIVLDVLIRKFKAIREATGVSVPVPDEADGVVEALLERLIRRHGDPDQLAFELPDDPQRTELFREWESAAERERVSRTKYAQDGIHPEEAMREAEAARSALGTRADIEIFTLEALRALGASVTPIDIASWRADTSAVPTGLRDALPPGLEEPLVLHRDLPIPKGQTVLARTDPTVEAVGRYVLDTALDPPVGARVATRAGVARSSAVSIRTTLLLLRFRFHIDLPGPNGVHQQVCEEARFAAFSGSPEHPEWLSREAVDATLEVRPDRNVDPAHATTLIDELSMAAHDWEPLLGAMADDLADELLDAHRRVRSGAGVPRRGLTVTAQKPVDLLGTYVILPVAVG